MKCNIRREEMKEKKVIRCCICGEEIIVREGNNPYPVREWSAIGTDKNRCCHKCNREIVLPSRFVARYAKNEQEMENYHKNLKRMSHEELREFFGVDNVA